MSAMENYETGSGRKSCSSFVKTPRKKVAFDDGFTEPNSWRIFDNWECNVPPATASGFEISPVTNVTMGRHKDKVSGIILFGGQRYPEDAATENDTWFFNIGEQLWSKIETKTNPQARSNHSMVTLCGETIVLMGGQQSTTVYNDVWIFNSTITEWIEVKVKPPTQLTLYNSTARVLTDRDSRCTCNQSVVVPEHPGSWSSYSNLWLLRCRGDQSQYKWVKLENNATAHLPKGRGRPKLYRKFNLTVSALKNGTIYGLTDNRIWRYSKPDSEWQHIHDTKELRKWKTNTPELMAFLDEHDKEKLLLINTANTTFRIREISKQNTTYQIRKISNQKLGGNRAEENGTTAQISTSAIKPNATSKFKWIDGIAVGNIPVRLSSMSTRQTR